LHEHEYFAGRVRSTKPYSRSNINENKKHQINSPGVDGGSDYCLFRLVCQSSGISRAGNPILIIGLALWLRPQRTGDFSRSWDYRIGAQFVLGVVLLDLAVYTQHAMHHAIQFRGGPECNLDVQSQQPTPSCEVRPGSAPDSVKSSPCRIY
jgi:hypothetical protein